LGKTKVLFYLVSVRLLLLNYSHDSGRM